jgi:hypothetical protein
VRELLPFALLAWACGVETRAAPAARAVVPPSHPAASAPAGTTSDASDGDAGRAFDEIEERWSGVVAGMRAVSALEGTAGDQEPLELARADGGDLCVRVAFESSGAIVASVLDGAGTVLAKSSEQASGVLPEHGPVCVRRGDSVRGHAAGPPAARVRWVTWAARTTR